MTIFTSSTVLRRVVVPTRRLVKTYSTQQLHSISSTNVTYQHFNHGTYSSWFPWLATAAVASYATATIAQSESPPSPPSKPQTQITWSQVLTELRHAQRTFSLSSGFTAIRRASPTDNSDATVFSLEFPVVRGADLYSVIVSLAGAFANEKDPLLRIEDSPTQTVLTISEAGRFEVAVSVPRLSPFNARVIVELDRSNSMTLFSQTEVSALIRAYCLCQTISSAERSASGHLLDGKASVDVGPPTVLDRSRIPSADETDDAFSDFSVDELESDQEQDTSSARSKLKELGVEVFDPTSANLTWEALAGYEEVKKRIEDTLTFPLRHPEVYEGIVRGTRKRFESNVPKAVLYEGPPGCGKTLSAKILAAAIGVPFVHVPLETILSKYYGETTRKLADILNTANQLGRCIVFIDECDSLGMRRDGATEMHEVTRRTLSVLLRHIDGMDGPQNTIVLAATNHKEDIDPALMSRFDVVVTFPLPDKPTRTAILELYAKHLSKEDMEKMSAMCNGFSGRELLDVCEEAERMHGGEVLRKRSYEKDDEEVSLPDLSRYEEAIRRKAPHVVSIEEEKRRRKQEIRRRGRIISKERPDNDGIPSIAT